MEKQCNAAGQLIDPEHAYKPVLGSGVLITTDGTKDTDAHEDVVAGKRYCVTLVTADVIALLGFDDTEDAENVMFVLNNANPVVHVQIPEGVTELHHQGSAASVALRMVEIDNG